MAGASCTLYSIGALLLSLGFLYCGAQFVLNKTAPSARRLLVASIIYLPCLSVLAVSRKLRCQFAALQSSGHERVTRMEGRNKLSVSRRSP